ncbi:hypothetical protein [Candidatus Methanarcanum hacksteinii]|uniref:hypothetical protein n=1 Tax=Candidatus Methanarcanum hacksteinii TaxID=2911857 RepID=UPI0037DCB6EF
MMRGTSLQDMVKSFSSDEFAEMMSKNDEGEVKVKKKTAIPKGAPMPKKVPVKKEQFETTGSNEEMIPLSEHNEKMKKQETKYEKLEKKYKDLSETNKGIKSELAKVKKALDVEKGKKEEAERKATELGKKYADATDEIKDLKKAIEKNDNSDVIKEKEDVIGELNKVLKDRESELKEKEKEIESLKEERDSLDFEKKQLMEEIESLKKEDAVEVKIDQSPIITRISATEFQSPSFNSARYRVFLSRDCRFMTFKADIMGSATCNNGTIMLPTLANFIPFTEKKDYGVQLTANGEMLIYL